MITHEQQRATQWREKSHSDFYSVFFFSFIFRRISLRATSAVDLFTASLLLQGTSLYAPKIRLFLHLIVWLRRASSRWHAHIEAMPTTHTPTRDITFNHFVSIQRRHRFLYFAVIFVVPNNVPSRSRSFSPSVTPCMLLFAASLPLYFQWKCFVFVWIPSSSWQHICCFHIFSTHRALLNLIPVPGK